MTSHSWRLSFVGMKLRKIIKLTRKIGEVFVCCIYTSNTIWNFHLILFINGSMHACFRELSKSIWQSAIFFISRKTVYNAIVCFLTYWDATSLSSFEGKTQFPFDSAFARVQCIESNPNPSCSKLRWQNSLRFVNFTRLVWQVLPRLIEQTN